MIKYLDGKVKLYYEWVFLYLNIFIFINMYMLWCNDNVDVELRYVNLLFGFIVYNGYRFDV